MLFFVFEYLKPLFKPNFLQNDSARRRSVARLADLSVPKLTGFAVFLAGQNRPALRDEWRSHLAGEADGELPAGLKLAAALGFVIAAIRYRVQDAADHMWVPVDAVLRSRKLSNLVVLIPTVTAAAILFRHYGFYELLHSVEDVFAIGTMLYGLIDVGRRYRDVKPPEPKARRAKE